MGFLIKHDSKLHTGKMYRHNFQWFNFEEENCLFYVWHKKEIKVGESKNLWSTMNVFFIKDSTVKIEKLWWEVEDWVLCACMIYSAFNEDDGGFYNFLPYFHTKQIEEKKALVEKLEEDNKDSELLIKAYSDFVEQELKQQ